MSFAAACLGVSPHLLSRMRRRDAEVVLRDVVPDEILRAGDTRRRRRRNGSPTRALTFRVKDWSRSSRRGTAHRCPVGNSIAGRSMLTPKLEKMAEANRTVVFHRVLDRAANARLLGSPDCCRSARRQRDPGDVLAFKIIEYLAAGAHCVKSTDGMLKTDLQRGITYLPDDLPPNDCFDAVARNQ